MEETEQEVFQNQSTSTALQRYGLLLMVLVSLAIIVVALFVQ